MGMQIRSSDEWVVVGEHQLPTAYAIGYTPSAGVDAPAWEVEYAVEAGVPRCIAVTVRANEGGREVQSADLRALRLDDLAEDAATNVARRQVQTDAGEVAWVHDLRRFRDVRAEVGAARRGSRLAITDELLRTVADVYREHLDDRPTEVVRRHLDLGSDRTARLYVKRARDRGFLGKAIPGKAGER